MTSSNIVAAVLLLELLGASFAIEPAGTGCWNGLKNIPCNMESAMNGDAVGGLYFRSWGQGSKAREASAVPHKVAHRGEYFEVYSPNITTVYSQVFWTMMEEVPLGLGRIVDLHYRSSTLYQIH